MRGALPTALALLAAAFAAGCSVPEGKAEHESSLKIHHAAGETRVPAQAERVVALSPDSLDTSLALGVKPVGVGTFFDGHVPTYLADRVRGVERTGTYAKPFMNAVEYVGADLILGQKDRQGTIVRELERFGAVVMSKDIGHSWEVNTRLFSEAMGRTDQGERVLSRYDGLVARSRARLGRLGDTRVSVVRFLPGGRVEAAGARSFAGVVLGQLRLGRPRRQQAERDAVRVRSLAELDADHILFSVAPGAERAAARVRAGGAWTRLRAVRAGRAHEVSDDPWRTGGGVIGATRAQRDLVRLLAP